MSHYIFSQKILADVWDKDVALALASKTMTESEKITILHYLAYEKHPTHRVEIEKYIQELKYQKNQKLNSTQTRLDDAWTNLQMQFDKWLEQLADCDQDQNYIFGYQTRLELLGIIAPYLASLFDSTLVASYVPFEDQSSGGVGVHRVQLMTFAGEEAEAKGRLGKFLKIDMSNFPIVGQKHMSIFEMLLVSPQKSIVFCAKAHRTFAESSLSIRLKVKLKNIGELLSNVAGESKIVQNLKKIELPEYVDDSVIKLYPLAKYQKNKPIQMESMGEFLRDPQNSNISIRQYFPAIEVGKGTSYVLYPVFIQGKPLGVVIVKLSEKGIPTEDYAKVEDNISLMHSRMQTIIREVEKQITTNVLTVQEQKQREVLVKTLGTTLAAKLIAEGVDVSYTNKPLSISFSDLVGFTKMAEKLPLVKLVEVVNSFFENVNKLVNRHGAYLDKFIGDAAMTLMGTPVDEVQDEKQQAIRMFQFAFDLIHMVFDLNKKYELDFDYYGVAPLRLRVGTFRGVTVVGNFGSSEKITYTALGDSVNVAARYQSASQPNHYVISEEDYQVLLEQGWVKNHFSYITQNQECDAYREATIDDIFKPTEVRLKGKTKPHQVRVVVMEPFYPLNALKQIKNAFKNRENGAQRVSEIIFGIKGNEDILTALDRIDLFMLRWVSKELSKKVEYQFDFSEVDEILAQNFYDIHKSIYVDSKTESSGLETIPYVVNNLLSLKAKVPPRVNMREGVSSGDISEGLLESVVAQQERSYFLIYLVNYVWLVQAVFIREVQKYQALTVAEEKTEI